MLGKAWFFNHHIDDRPEAPDRRPAASRTSEAIERAAEILLERASIPIIYGLSRHDLRSAARGRRASPTGSAAPSTPRPASATGRRAWRFRAWAK